MYILYWDRGGANMAAHALLEEIGKPYELRLVDLDKGEQRDPDYLKLNPHARVPTLIYDKDQVMYESAAITIFLADRHPEIGMAPAAGHEKRGLYLQWMAYLTNTVQEALMHLHHPDFYIAAEGRPALVSAAEQRLLKTFGYIDTHLSQRGPFLCGEKLLACDYFLAMLTRWSRSLPKNARHFPSLLALITCIQNRDAYRRMMAQETLTAWP